MWPYLIAKYCLSGCGKSFNLGFCRAAAVILAGRPGPRREAEGPRLTPSTFAAAATTPTAPTVAGPTIPAAVGSTLARSSTAGVAGSIASSADTVVVTRANEAAAVERGNIAPVGPSQVPASDLAPEPALSAQSRRSAERGLRHEQGPGQTGQADVRGGQASWGGRAGSAEIEPRLAHAPAPSGPLPEATSVLMPAENLAVKGSLLLPKSRRKPPGFIRVSVGPVCEGVGRKAGGARGNGRGAEGGLCAVGGGLVGVHPVRPAP